jgi:hypothetical protein
MPAGEVVFSFSETSWSMLLGAAAVRREHSSERKDHAQPHGHFRQERRRAPAAEYAADTAAAAEHAGHTAALAGLHQNASDHQGADDHMNDDDDTHHGRESPLVRNPRP